MGEFVDFSRMTAQQQQDACEHLETQNLKAIDMPNWRFYVRNDGLVTRQKGCHKATDATEAEHQEMLRRASGGPSPSKDQPVPVKSGVRFSFSRD